MVMGIVDRSGELDLYTLGEPFYAHRDADGLA